MTATNTFLKNNLYWVLLSILILAPFGAFLLQVVKTLFASSGRPLSDIAVMALTGWKELLLVLGYGLVFFCLLLNKSRGFKLNSLDKALIVLMVAGVVYGYLVSPNWKQIVFGFRYDFLVFLFYLLARFVKIDWLTLKKILKILVWASVPIFIFGLLQTFIFPKGFMEIFGYSNIPSATGNPIPPYHLIGPNIVRAMGTFPGPNSLAMYSAFIFLTTIFLGKQILKNWQRYFVAGLSLITLLATFSRAHLVSLLGALALGFIFFQFIPLAKSKIAKIYPTIVTVVLLAVMAFIVAATFALSSFSLNKNAGAGGDLLIRPVSTQAHTFYREKAWEVIKTKPWGSGLGTAGLATTNTGGEVFNPESWPIQMVYEFGWLGLLMILLILYVFMVFILREYQQAKDKIFWRYFFTSFLAIFLSANFLPSWFEATSLMWWMVFGLFITSNEIYEKKN